MTNRETIIQNYIDGYNEFDIYKMVKDLHETIMFENILNGKTTMSLSGLKAFKEQAEESKNYFSARTQTIKSYTHQKDETEIEIDYNAVLAIDFSNDLKAGDELKLTGKSIFTFLGEKIIRLTDIS